jgi:PTH1 family peptidyl-tRNA hydrolase
LADIIEKLGTKDFARLRVGIGQADAPDTVSYVLGKITGEQEDSVLKGIEKARKAVFCWMDKGIDAAMNEYNGSDNDS